jgi:hypothetical protein
VSEPVKYSESRMISMRELEARPGKPSQILREVEADMIGRLARSVALSDRRFDGWPTVELRSDYSPSYLADRWMLHATVTTR